jgi:hypothetical protein
MFANCQAGGTDNGFPNVCLVPAPPAPPVPTPMPCIGNGAIGVPAAYTILFASAPAHNMGTSIPVTQGGPPGIAGIVSGTIMAKATPTTGAFTCLIAGKPATRLTAASVGNLSNCPTTVRIAPSQTKILILAG